MRIGLFGGMANNLYLFGKALADVGLDVVQVRDRTDSFAFSQPSWEDVHATLDQRQIADSHLWPRSEWNWYEEQWEWQAPSWLLDPAEDGPFPNGVGQHLASDIRRSLLEHVGGSPQLRAAFAELMRCDVLLSGSINGHLMALLSGKPYVVFPHGGDIQIAAGLLAPPLWHPVERLRHHRLSNLLAEACRQAVAVGATDPTGQGGHLGDASGLMTQVRHVFLPIPLQITSRPDAAGRACRLDELCRLLGISRPSQPIIGVCPARLEFYMKGQDRLIRALDGHKDIHMLFLGWGSDYESAVRLATELGVADQVSFIRRCVSKPIIYDLVRACDFTADQFCFGLYGSAATEAMSVGAPLMAYIDEECFRRTGRQIPGIINVSTTAQIAQVFSGIEAGNLDLERIGVECSRFVEKTNAPGAVVNTLCNIYRGSI